MRIYLKPSGLNCGFYVKDLPCLQKSVNNGHMQYHLKFKKYHEFTREQIASTLAPQYQFRAQTGTWGLHGIVQFGEGPNYAFFVTYGQEQSGHQFDEGISESGVLRWQSQPRHNFKSQVISDLIGHDENRNHILLFLRSEKQKPYVYLGQLKYLAHDAERTEPVHFQWQIIDFNKDEAELERFGIRLDSVEEEVSPSPQDIPLKQTLTPVEQPKPNQRTGNELTTKRFRATAINYEDRDQRNRKLGRLGEDLVIIHEKERLISSGKAHLAEKVEHVSVTLGDGAGFDIRSFDPVTDEELHIEVKTTSGPKNTSFFMSSNELRYVESCNANYILFRIFDYSSSSDKIEFFIMKKEEILKSLDFVPVSYRVGLKKT